MFGFFNGLGGYGGGVTSVAAADVTDAGATGISLLQSATPGAATDILFTASNTIASNASVALGASNKPNVIISGTTTITSFDTVAAGILRFVKFSGALTLTYNATSLILPGTANIATAANDTAIFQSLGSGNWICTQYKRANGKSVTPPAASDITGTLAAASGGTGQALYTVGDLLYANTTTTLAKLADAALLNTLISGGVGVAPSWGKVGYGAIQNVTATDKLLGRSTAGAGIVEEIACPAFGRSLIASASAAAAVLTIAPQIHGILVGTTTVVFSSQNFVTIFTTPNDGSNFIWTNLEMEITAISSPVGVNVGVASLGFTAAGYNDWVYGGLPATGFNAVNNCFGFNWPADGNGRAPCPANTAIKVGCGVPITSGSVTVLFKLYGRFLG